jgi:hypothetical protein
MPLTPTTSATSGLIARPVSYDLDYLFPKAGVTIYQASNNFFTYGTDGSDTIHANYTGITYAGAGNDTVIGWSTTQPLVV